MEIRLAAPQDMDALVDLRLEMLREVNHLPAGYAFDRDFVRRIRACFRDPRHAWAMAVADGQRVGCATLCAMALLPTFDHPSGLRGHLMNVYTCPAWRRQGIGRQLVALLVEEGRRRGMTEISLDATEDGRQLYRALGFRDNAEGMVLALCEKRT